MEYLVNGKVYNTDTSEKICTFIRSFKYNTLLGTVYPKFRCTLYKSKKGQFFYHIGECVSSVAYDDRDDIVLIDENEVKKILTDIQAIDEYEELFGEIEEG